MNEFTFLVMLFTHWFGDFVLQTDKEAKGKSKNFNDLISHTETYTVFWGVVLLVLMYFVNFPFGLVKLIVFLGITFICHTTTDFFTSKLNTYLWTKGRVHDFFVSIGFDQILHYLQLYYTFKLLLP